MDNAKQVAKGNDIVQNFYNINKNYLNFNKEDVEKIVLEVCTTKKDAIIEIVKEVIESLPYEDRVFPDKRIFIPILQQLSYSLDDEIIKQSYKKLLESSMNKQKNSDVHPSFVNIISQLNSDEVKLLNVLVHTTIKSYPLIDMRVRVGNGNDLGLKQVSNFSDLAFGVCDFPGNIGKYIENFERLKLIEIPSYVWLTDKTLYEPLKNHFMIKAIMQRNDENCKGSVHFKYDFTEKTFNLTSFGCAFLNCCV